MSQDISPDVVMVRCPDCAEARQLAGRLEQLIHQGSKLGLIGAPSDHDNFSLQSDPLRVINPRVTCKRCQSTGLVLSPQGESVVWLLAQQGIINLAEARAAAAGAQKGGADEPA